MIADLFLCCLSLPLSPLPSFLGINNQHFKQQQQDGKVCQRVQLLNAIQECLPPDSKICIVNDKREVIHHGPTLRKGMLGSSPGYLFLFNDLILSCLVTSDPPPPQQAPAAADVSSSIPSSPSSPVSSPTQQQQRQQQQQQQHQQRRYR